MPQRKPGPSVKDPKMYEALRDDGASKEKAARISNAAANTSRSSVGKKGGTGRLSRGQDAELVAVWVGHDHPADVALADVDASRPEGDEPVDFRLLVAADGWSDVEV
jgi:hypothetical protein